MTPLIKKDWDQSVTTLMKCHFTSGAEHTRKTQAINFMEDAVFKLIGKGKSEHEAQDEIARAFKSPATVKQAVAKYNL